MTETTRPSSVACDRAIQRPCWCSESHGHLIGEFGLGRGEVFPLVECNGCGVQAIYPQPNDEVLHAHYSSEYYGSSRRKFVWPFSAIIGWFQSGRARLSARFVRPSMEAGNRGVGRQQPRRVLDIGCGNGGYLMHMKQRGFHVEGTEWTAESAGRIPVEEGITIHVGDLLTLDLPENSYDLITMWHVLEHVRQPDEVLRKIHRLLKSGVGGEPGGKLLLALPNAQSDQARRFGLGWLHYDPPRHLCNFGVQSLTKLLNQIGFDIEWLTTHSLEQNTFGHIQSWLNAKGYPRDRLYSMLKGLGNGGFGVKLKDLFWLAILFGPALVITTWQSMRGRGATMTLCATSSANDAKVTASTR